jgi:thiamine pyrophosphokinase
MDEAPVRARAVIVVAGGDPVDPATLAGLPGGATVVAADSGVDVALELGLEVHVAVGDFDSVDPASLGLVAASGARIDRHPEAKDATDLELALDVAVSLGAEQVVVLGGHGGRLDHHLANAALLAAPGYAGVELTAHMGGATVWVVRRTRRLTGQAGDLVTLLAVGGPALGVTTEGLRYPLEGDELHPGSTRGVSNELVGDVATVTTTSGVLLAVRPGPDRPPDRTT